MKIRRNNSDPRETTIADINAGEPFRLADDDCDDPQIYICTDEQDPDSASDDHGDLPWFVVDVTDGCLWRFSGATAVIPVNATLVVDRL